MSVSRLPASLRGPLVRLLDDVRGLAMIELAYIAPFFVAILGGGIELVNYATTHMRVSQIAVSLADNASRAKQDVVSGVPRMREADVNEAFLAAQIQSGPLDVATNGRIILSSLQRNAAGGQWIQWQRCFGASGHASSYGFEGDGSTGNPLTGLGPPGRQVAAEAGSAIMFVEVVYEYEPLLFGRYFGLGVIRKAAAMYVRDERDLSGIFNPAPASVVNRCD
jgi:hypothetical protein